MAWPNFGWRAVHFDPSLIGRTTRTALLENAQTACSAHQNYSRAYESISLDYSGHLKDYCSSPNLAKLESSNNVLGQKRYQWKFQKDVAGPSIIGRPIYGPHNLLTNNQ